MTDLFWQPPFSLWESAQAKSFIDRLNSFGLTNIFLVRNCLITPSARNFHQPAGTKLPNVFDGALQVARYFFLMMEIELVSTCCYPGIDHIGDIQKTPASLQKVYDLGKKLGS